MKALLLPLSVSVLLASCAVTPPQPPLKVGETLEMAGTTRSGLTIKQTYPIKRDGVFAQDTWTYRSFDLGSGTGDDATFGVGVVTVDGSGEWTTTEYLDTKLSESVTSMKTLCMVFTDNMGWRSAEGFFIHDKAENVRALLDRLDTSSEAAAARTLLSAAGTCTLSRK